jgi:hypothetical protein
MTRETLLASAFVALAEALSTARSSVISCIC